MFRSAAQEVVALERPTGKDCLELEVVELAAERLSLIRWFRCLMGIRVSVVKQICLPNFRISNPEG